MRIAFYGNNANRRFYPGPSAPYGPARGACSIPGPAEDSELEWFSLSGTIAWSTTNRFQTGLYDSDGDDQNGPTQLIGYGKMLNQFYPDVTGGTVNSGSRGFMYQYSDDDGPFGDVRFVGVTRIENGFSGGTSRYYAFSGVTRMFTDNIAPSIEALVSESDNGFDDPQLSPSDILQPDTYAVSAEIEDEGTGCQSGSITVTDPNGVAAQVAVGCNPGIEYPFMLRGTYRIDATGVDKMGNTASDTQFVRIADPIRNIAAGMIMTGEVSVNIEVPTNVPSGLLGGGRVELQFESTQGVRSILAGPITTSGEQTVIADFSSIQSQPGTLELVFIDPSGELSELEVVDVDVSNPHLMQLAANANSASSQIVAGVEMVHASGTLSVAATDFAQPTIAGRSLQLSRSYNSAQEHAGLLGRGWHTSYEQRIVVGADLAATFVDANGREWVFLPADETVTEYEPAPGYLGTLLPLPTGGWSLTHPDGQVLEFDTSGRITVDRVASGHEVTYSAIADDGQGNRTFAISDDSRSIVGTVNSAGQLVSTTNPVGRTMQYRYTAGGLLDEVEDGAGGVWSNQYNVSGLLSSVTDPVGNTTSVAYEPAVVNGHLRMQVATATNPVAEPRNFTFTNDSETVTEVFGGRATVSTSDESGQLIERTDAEGNTATTDYNDAGQIVATEDEAGNTTATSYTAEGFVEIEIDAEENQVTHSAWDQFGNPQSTVDEDGFETARSYDAEGRKVSETVDGHTTEWTYSGVNTQPATQTNPLGHVLTFQYAPTGGVTQEAFIDENGDEVVTTTAAFNDAGDQVSQQSPGELSQTFEYDDAGRLTKTIDGLGRYSDTTYDLAGRAVAQRDMRGFVSTTEYDELGNVARSENALTEATSTIYNEHSEAIIVTDAAGIQTIFTYDETGNQLTETTANGQTTSSTYDGVGNQLTETEPGGFTTSFEYDANGNETAVTGPDGASTQSMYDGRGNVVSTTDEMGRSTSYAIDARGLTTSVIAPASEQANDHDAAGRLIRTTDALGHATEYSLDRLGRTTSTLHADGTTTSVTFDAAGRVTSQTDQRGATTTFSFDNQGRLASRQPATGNATTFQYDESGNVLREQKGPYFTTFTYDAAGRKTETLTASSNHPESKKVAYSYDAAGRLRQEQHLRGNSGLFVATETIVSEYDLMGRVQLTGRLHSNNQTDGTKYEYDIRGNVKRESQFLRIGTSTSGESTVKNFTYDSQGRVKTVAGTGTTTYTYHPDGQVSSRTAPDSEITTFAYGPTSLPAVEVSNIRGTTERVFTATGQVASVTTSAGTVAYEHDELDRVVSVESPNDDPGNGGHTIAYDAVGNVQEVVASEGLLRYRDEQGRVRNQSRYSHSNLRGYSADGTLDYDRQTAGGNEPGSISYYDYDGRKNVKRIRTGTIPSSSFVNSPSLEISFASSHSNPRFGTTSYSSGTVTVREDADGKADLRYLEFTTPSGAISRDVIVRQGQIVVERDSAEVSTGKQLNAYTYQPGSGRLATHTHRDRFVTHYTYGAKNNLAGLARRAVIPSRVLNPGVNTTQEDSDAAACIASVQHPSCPAGLGAVVTELGKVFPTFYDDEQIESDPEYLVIARYMHARPASRIAIQTATTNPLGQIQSVTDAESGELTQFAYDDRGNTSTQTGSSGETENEYDYRNLLTHYQRITGDPSSGTRLAYSQFDGLLRRSESAAGRIIQYEFDLEARLRRITSTQAPSGEDLKIRLLHDSHGLSIIEDQTDTQPVAYYPYFNNRGDIKALATSTGIVATIDYDPFGKHRISYIVDNASVRRITQIFNYNARDGVITQPDLGGLIYMKARHYNPQTGTFLQADPLPAQEGTPDTNYSYAGNDPVNKVDPEGTTCKKALKQSVAGGTVTATGSIKCSTSADRNVVFRIWVNACRFGGGQQDACSSQGTRVGRVFEVGMNRANRYAYVPSGKYRYHKKITIKVGQEDPSLDAAGYCAPPSYSRVMTEMYWITRNKNGHWEGPSDTSNGSYPTQLGWPKWRAFAPKISKSPKKHLLWGTKYCSSKTGDVL